jgi:hypothetical protein
MMIQERKNKKNKEAGIVELDKEISNLYLPCFRNNIKHFKSHFKKSQSKKMRLVDFVDFWVNKITHSTIIESKKAMDTVKIYLNEKNTFLKLF